MVLFVFLRIYLSVQAQITGAGSRTSLPGNDSYVRGRSREILHLAPYAGCLRKECCNVGVHDTRRRRTYPLSRASTGRFVRLKFLYNLSTFIADLPMIYVLRKETVVNCACSFNCRKRLKKLISFNNLDTVSLGESRDFMAIVLYGGFIRVVISLGAQPLTLTVARGPRLDDGEWHHVAVRQELKVLAYTLISVVVTCRDIELIILSNTEIVHNSINRSELEANRIFKINA